MIHERVDIEHWKRVFPLGSMREQAREYFRRNEKARERYSQYLTGRDPDKIDYLYLRWPNGGDIVGPYDVAILEQKRAEAFPPGAPGPHLPTDVFVWGWGEPARREVTKVGGSPYRSARRPWPHTPAGVPMTFIAQVCFADSMDIMGPLPGDILLVFADRDSFYELKEWSTVVEWADLGEHDLISRDAIPATNWPLAPMYGAIYRTWDFPEVEHKYQWDSAGEYYKWSDLGVVNATKIGGVPFWCQHEAEPEDGYLCTVSSVLPVCDLPFPFLNVPQPISWSESRRDDLLCWGDSGQFNIFRQPDGGLSWAWDCC